jgi:hypothetical protein
VDLGSIEPYVETGPPDVRYWEGYVPTSVTIETVKGTFDDHMPLLQRLTEAQLLEKFVDNVAPAIGEAGARELADLTLRLEELPRASALLDRVFA